MNADPTDRAVLNLEEEMKAFHHLINHLGEDSLRSNHDEMKRDGLPTSLYSSFHLAAERWRLFWMYSRASWTPRIAPSWDSRNAVKTSLARCRRYFSPASFLTPTAHF